MLAALLPLPALALPALALPALAHLPPPTAPSDELPIDTWIDRVEDLDAITFHYRVVNAEGVERFFDLSMSGSTLAHLDYEDGADRVRAWIEDGIMTTLIEKEGEAPMVVSADFGAVVEGPRDWLDSTVESVGLPDLEMPSPRTQLMIWPADDDRTWNFQLNCGVTTHSPFAWLERLRHTEHVAEATDDGYIARLDDGAEFLLDETLGFVRRVVIDHQDHDAGIIEAVEVDVDADVDAGLFTPEVPDDAEVQESGDLERQLERKLWKMVRFEVSRAVVAAEQDEAGFLAENEDALSEHLGEFYVLCFAVEIEGTLERTKEYLDEQIDHLLEVWARSTDREADRPRFEAAKQKLAEVLATDTQRAAEAYAERLVVRPIEDEDADLDRLLELERGAAARALYDAFHAPSKEYMDERLAEADDDGGRR